MLQGMNITVTIKRNTRGADDIVGGAVTLSEATIYTKVKARLSNLKPSQELRTQGVEASKFYNAVIEPIALLIRENDYLYPESGSHVGKQFKVLGVQIDSITPNDPRAHISLRLERIDRARSLQ